MKSCIEETNKNEERIYMKRNERKKKEEMEKLKENQMVTNKRCRSRCAINQFLVYRRIARL